MARGFNLYYIPGEIYVKIILKYYKVNPNNILIDNIDINDISKYELSKEISYISQNETLFTQENDLLGRKVKNKNILR